MEPLFGVAEVRRHSRDAILYEGEYQPRVEGKRVEATDKLFAIPATRT